MKITKKVREEAATICSALACDAHILDSFVEDAADSLGASIAAFAMAEAAWEFAWRYRPAYDDAEAEALIRTGWVPS